MALRTRISFLLLFFIMLCKGAGSQDRNMLDSLYSRLNEQSDHRSKIGILVELSRHYRQIDPDTAFQYIISAQKLSELHNVDEYLGEIHSLKGDIHVMHDSLDAAISEYNASLEYYQNEENTEEIAGVYLIMGNIYLVKDDLVNAKYYYLESLKLAEENKLTRILSSLYNNIGIISQELERYTEALEYYGKANELNLQLGDSLEIAYNFMNIGDVYMKLEEFDLAGQYYQDVLNKNLLADNYVTKSNVYQNLANIEIERGNYELAEEYLDLSYDLLQKPDRRYLGPKNISLSNQYYLMGLAAFHLEDQKEALEYMKKAYQLSSGNEHLKIALNSSEHLKDIYANMEMYDSALFFSNISKELAVKVSENENIHQLNQLEQEYEFEQKLRQKEEREEAVRVKQRRLAFFSIAIISGLILALIILFLVFRLSKNRMRQMMLETEALQKELEFRNKELTTNVMYLVKKNEMIMRISDKLRGIDLNDNRKNEQIINDLIRELESGATEDSWKDFEIRFQQVHTGFYKTLSKDFPDLTPNELRLCAFLRLNMSTKDISAITYQTANSIDVARFRLRQKLGLTKEDNLVAFLSKY